ncbi:MAG TPA: succinate dehydrogenase, cytochrome b556 subunit [Xanthomonadales bacterium]|nr:succinate dehydrogenase, cytochrome b556 subunit [Xanthomonadales bacterium]
MNSKQRPISPFMLGPYYKPQITSVLSILHRITGVVLIIVGAPLLLWWLVALGQGAESYAAMQESLGGILGRLASLAINFSLSFHFFNGIRHLFWDAGMGLEIQSARTSGWAVVILSVALTATLGVITQ